MFSLGTADAIEAVMERLPLLTALFWLTGCSAQAPEHQPLTPADYSVHLVGPDGFLKGPFVSLAACEHDRAALELRGGWGGDWGRYRCL